MEIIFEKKWLAWILFSIVISILVYIAIGAPKEFYTEDFSKNFKDKEAVVEKKDESKDSSVSTVSINSSPKEDKQIVNSSIEELIESTKNQSQTTTENTQYIEPLDIDSVYSHIKSKYYNKKDSELKQVFEENLPDDHISHNHDLDLISNLDGKPKLAIVIDDVSFGYQLDSILNLNLIINIALMPKSKRYPNTPILAQRLDNYMVHFPLEAMNYRKSEDGTLLVGDSYETVENRVKYIREIFPKAKIINNHTGSKFTSNYEAMDKLMRALKKYNFSFLDSRTISSTVCEKVAKKNHIGFNARNIFLDNTHTLPYIQGQLKKAINMAKKKGYAIAIGHPYRITIETLSKSKELLDDVELVYVDSLMVRY
jgi:polysaccharide deacetylase 2 family uncharacterized protein YibQ